MSVQPPPPASSQYRRFVSKESSGMMCAGKEFSSTTRMVDLPLKGSTTRMVDLLLKELYQKKVIVWCALATLCILIQWED
jgi:hypothetical protein